MKTTVAIIGEYQIGKSTLLNSLLKCQKAATGRGLRTTVENQRYELTPFVDLIDTPGFGVLEADDATASSAIQDAFAFVYVMKAKTLDDTAKIIIRKMFKTGRRCIFVYNCNNTECWDPEDENNDDICQTIKAEIKSVGLNDLCMSVDGQLILKINAQWALYGLGLLQQKVASGNLEDASGVAKDIRKIELFIKRELEEIHSARYREEMLRRSNIKVLRDFLEEMPLKVLMSFSDDMSNEIKRFSDRFLADLQSDCNECASRLKRVLAK